MSSSVTLNFSDSDDSGSYDVVVTSGETTLTENTGLNDNGSYTQFSFTPGITGGTITANVTNNDNQSSATRSFQFDNGAPSINNLNLDSGARVNSEFGPIEFGVSDSFSDVSSLSLSISKDGNTVYDSSLECDGDSCEKDVNFPSGQLNSGTEYELEIYREDSEGNSNTRTISFVYDDQYEGDTSPTVDEDFGPDVYRIESGETEFEIPVTLSPGNEESAITVSCIFNGDRQFDQSGLYVGDTEETVFCGLNPFSRGEMQFDFSLKLEDEADNSHTHEVGNYYFDITPPTMENLSTVVGVFNSDFEVSYNAYDTRDVDGLDVAKIHYQLDNSDLDLQEGMNVSEVDGEFQVDTEGLSAGEHTVYAWAVDRAGRVSEASSLEFDFMPSATPKASISVDQEMSVVAGESKTIRSNISNTGQLLIGEMEVKLSSDIANRSRTIRELKPGEKTDAIFNIDTEPSYLGAHTLELSTQSPDTSKNIRFIVEANKEQEQQIESNYNEYIEKYNALKENVTQLKDSGLSSSREETLDANTSEFFSDMEAAERAKQSGDLYKVENRLENISNDYSAASTSYSTVKEQHEAAEWNRTVGLFLLIFVGLGGSGLAYIAFFSDQYYLDLEALQDEYEFLEGPVETVQTTLDQYELSLEPLENAVEYVGELLAEEEEELEQAEEQAFQGFT